MDRGWIQWEPQGQSGDGGQSVGDEDRKQRGYQGGISLIWLDNFTTISAVLSSFSHA